MNSAYSRKVRLLLEDRDLDSLVALLRSPTQPDIRLQAAAALGELGNVEATESLVRSALEDPDVEIQAASRQALEQLHGNQAQQIIDSYSAGSFQDDPWLVEYSENDDDENDIADELDLDGLMRIASHESDTALRLKAIHMLAFSKDMRATDILAYLALRDANKTVRAAARNALNTRHGDQAEEILKNYQDDLSPADDEEEFEDDLDEEETGDETDLEEDDDELSLEQEPGDENEKEERSEVQGYDRIPTTPSKFPRVPAQSNHTAGVVEDEGFPWQRVLMIGMIILIIVVVLLFLSGRL
jgi:HEAT repeat protein